MPSVFTRRARPSPRQPLRRPFRHDLSNTPWDSWTLHTRTGPMTLLMSSIRRRQQANRANAKISLLQNSPTSVLRARLKTCRRTRHSSTPTSTRFSSPILERRTTCKIPTTENVGGSSPRPRPLFRRRPRRLTTILSSVLALPRRRSRSHHLGCTNLVQKLPSTSAIST